MVSRVSDHQTVSEEGQSKMPSNVTKIVCDIVPVWSGYMLGAQVCMYVISLRSELTIEVHTLFAHNFPYISTTCVNVLTITKCFDLEESTHSN